jgi:hypothetical protein
LEAAIGDAFYAMHVPGVPADLGVSSEMGMPWMHQKHPQLLGNVMINQWIWGMPWYTLYPLVNIQKAMENNHL